MFLPICTVSFHSLLHPRPSRYLVGESFWAWWMACKTIMDALVVRADDVQVRWHGNHAINSGVGGLNCY